MTRLFMYASLLAGRQIAALFIATLVLLLVCDTCDACGHRRGRRAANTVDACAPAIDQCSGSEWVPVQQIAAPLPVATTDDKDTAVDPVCKMEIKKADALMTEHKGVRYYFCNQECKDKFLKDPERYVPKKK